MKFKKEFGFVTTAERSALMSKIRSTKTKPEIRLRKALWECGIRYRVNYKKLPGSPDILITKKMIAIFVDGEFWHGYKWDEKKLKIKANRGFWIPKIERNMERDCENNKALIEGGFTVLRFWEHEIKKDLDKCLATIFKNINK